MAALLLTACGQPRAIGQVIGVRTVPSATANPGALTISTDAIARELALQLKEANDVPRLPAGDAASGELPLDAYLTVKQIERLLQLQSSGALEIDTWLNAIAALRSQVAADQAMTFAQKGNITAILDRSAAGLNGILVRITRDRMVDQARADLTTIGLARVRGLLEPQIHLLIASYQMQQLALNYGSQRASLQQQINAQQLTNPNLAPAQTLVNEMVSQIEAMQAAGQRASALLVGLKAADYPGNRYGLSNAQQSLLAGKAAGDRVAEYRRRALAYLGL